ncbi:MAG: ABC transporter ATP-binding protein [Candidatus Heimdallarchaeota archaeon]
MIKAGEAFLECRGVAKYFGALRAVDHIDMAFPERKISLLIGPNGSGKTTLLNCLTGIYRPEFGQVLYCGEDITGWPSHKIARYLARTFQIPQPFPRLTVLENLCLGTQDNPGENIIKAFLKLRWLDKELETIERAFDILTLLDMDHLWDKLGAELSGGQLKLLELGRALMTGATTLLMDEPVGSINPVLAHNLFQHMINLRDRLGMTMVVVEHRLDLAIKYADYAYCLDAGKIACEGTPKEVVNDPKVIEAYTEIPMFVEE